MEKQNIHSNEAVKIDSVTYEDNYDVEKDLRTYDQINDSPADDHGPHSLYESVSSRPLNLEIVPAVVNEEQFEVVSLRDTVLSSSQAICESSMHTSDNRDNKSSILSDLFKIVDPSRDDEMHIEHECSSGNLIHYNTDQYSSNNSESGMYMDGGSSPVGSLLKPRTKPSMPNVSPELLHLVDSAIMGKPESLDKLKNVVSGIEIFENVDDETDSIALLVVDSLLATMGGVESFDEDEGSNPPSVMLNSRAAIVAAELIPWLPYVDDSEGIMSPRTRMVRGLLAILRACTRNRSMCSIAGLLGVLLTSAERVFVKENSSMKRWDGTPLCHCICHLAGHSLSPADLRKWFLVISRTLDTVWGTHMMLTLEKAIGGKESKGPACTFEFDGESSGLLGPGESRWPFASGYAFATWIYVESFADTLNAATAAATIAAAAAKSGKSSAMSAAAAASALAGEGTAHMPRLFSFLTSDNQGVEAYFHAQFLVVESGMGKGKKFSLHFTHVFKPQCWYFIGLEHVVKPGLIGKSESELRLYIDGSLYESRQFEFPRISKPLAFCCIGTNPPPTIAGLQRRRRQCPLFAEIGPIYIFKEPIGPENMGCLASRCGDAVPYFGNGAGHPWLSTNDYVRSMTEESMHLDSEISGHIHLIYHPKLLNGRFCPDVSPSGAAGHIRRPAEVLGQVHIAIRMRPVDAMWALAYGGPMCLLPFLVRNINKESLEPEQGGLPLCVAAASLTAPIFRIISICIQYPSNSDEVARICGPEVLSRTLSYFLETLSSLDVGIRGGIGEELVVAVVSLCQSEKINHSLKVQFFINLLLDIKLWSSCDYGIQKKLLSSLADMVFTELTVMRDANAIQMLLDGCRCSYWSVREPDSTPCFSVTEKSHNIGEVNALVDELFVVIELLVGAASPSLAGDDVACLLRFMVDNQQPNQVTRVLSLFYRLVAQPNTSRAHKFAKEFISCGGIETLLVLLQRETKIGDFGCQESSGTYIDDLVHCSTPERNSNFMENAKLEDVNSSGEKEPIFKEEGYESSLSAGDDSVSGALHSYSERTMSASESFFLKHFGGKSFLISSDNARNNVYNVDESDGIVVGIISLIGALISLGYLKVGSQSSPALENNFSALSIYGEGNPMYDDKISLLLFALKNVFQAAPRRLMTMNAYTSLLTASINVSSTGDVLNFYDSGHRFEHFHILNVLLHSLPYASGSFQCRAIQDLLFLVCSHPENRSSFTKMEAWPEWILEVLISNYETKYNKGCASGSLGDIEDIAHSFLIIMLEHSMRQKDGWKDVEATIHCAEWLSMVGGSSSGGRRARREESLPIFKRRLLGGLLDFSTRELRVQTQVIAAASAGVAAEGLSPKESKVEAENAAQLSVALVENAIVILMLVEDHLRLQSKLSTSSCSKNSTTSLLSLSKDSSYFCGRQSTNEAGGLSLDILASMADENGQLSTAVMERLTAAAAAEPYESVSCAFVSYGSCTNDQAKGWEYRSRLWYGVSHPTKTDVFGGGGSGWESWNSILEKDMNGDWIELPLIKKSVAMLQALLLDESGLGGGLGIGGGSGTGMGGMAALYQLLDSDQPFMCMLRMTLASMREEDNGDGSLPLRDACVQDGTWNGVARGSISEVPFSAYKSQSALLWSVLSPLLNMPVLESKRQRVLVASCILYSEVWHAVSIDRKPLRKRYLEAFLPPFVALLRRWRPLLAGIHELATAEGFNPLVVDGRVLAADALPIEASLAMISPEWAAAFASPPAAMALAMIAAGAAGAETSTGRTTGHLRRESSLLERRTAKLHTFSSFQKPLQGHSCNKAFHVPKDKAAAKAAALAAARDIERTAKIGSGRGLSAIAMATSSQRRSNGDMERVRRWNNSEAMGAAWTECLQSADTKSGFGNDYCALSYKFVAVLVTSFALARNMQRAEIDRHAQANVVIRHRICTSIRMWRKLIHCLEEMDCLFGACGEHLSSEHVFWKLDFMESSSRMRQCLKRNYKGSYHDGAAANYADDITPGNVLRNVMNSPNNSILTAEAISVDSMNEEDGQIEYGNSEGRSHDKDPLINNNSVPYMPEKPPISLDGPSNSLLSNDHDPNLAPSVASPRHVPIEVNERIIIELSSSMIRPLRVVHGTFQVTTKRINFLVVESEQNPMTDQHSAPKHHEKNRSWLVSSVHQIYSRRFLLRRSGLELFMVDRSNFFFDFGSVEARRDAYKAIVQAHPPHLNNIYLATQKPELLLKRTQLMERWARWEISNFEYLMQLNTLAGRSYNDITQYPVFPWILSDYTSKSLNLEDPSSFRDLSKPVGALDVERLQKFQERYSSFDDPIIPKFHYGSHYSTAGTVLYYLVRVEPFSTLAIQLQGGKFDHADRMFSDIGATWKGVLEDMSDVKELVPELFYLPEVLTNENSIDFGTTQLGETLDFVSLPPWAENPVDFIHKHRMALESEHVSSHLNEWIDLIFGYKQCGKEAQLANNVFFYITYEGAVNIDKIHDPVQQRATQDQIAYFGQTPSQLLTTPHLKKLPLSEVLHLQTIFRNPKAVKSYVVPSPELCNLPAAIIHASSDIVVADTNVPAAHVVKHKWQPNTPDGHGMPFLFQHGKPASSSGGGTFMRMFKGSTSTPVGSQFPQAVAFPCSGIRRTSIVCVTSDKEIITGGHADNSIRLLSSDNAKTIEVAMGHCAPVTCLNISPDSSYLITGSRDTTLILWKLHILTSSSFTTGAEPPTAPVTPTSTGGNTVMDISVGKGHRPRVEGPIHVLRGHISEVTCCCVDSDIGIVASSSESSGVLIHSIRKGCLIRKLSGVKAHSICLSSEGVILTWSKEAGRLDAFTLNGIRISTMKVPHHGTVGCMEISSDGRYVSVGLNRSPPNVNEKSKKIDSDVLDIHVPSICFLDLYKLEVVHVMELGEEQDVTTIALNKDNTNLLVSTADRQFMVVTDPTLSLKVVNQMLKLGWEGDGLSPLVK